MHVLRILRLGCGLARAETEGPLDFHTPCPFGKTRQDLACLACTHHFERLEHTRAIDAAQAAAFRDAR